MLTEQKKILVVYDVAYPFVKGGGQKRLWEVSTRLRKKGYEIDWICFKTWSGEEVLIKNGIKYIGLPGFKGLYNKNGKRRKLEPLEFIFQLFKSEINYKEYKIIWSGQWPFLHLLYWLFSSRVRLKNIVIDWWEIWGTTWFKYSKFIGWAGYILENFLIKIYAKYSSIVVISDRSKNLAINLTFSSPNIDLIHNGISFEENIPYIEKKYDFIYLGRLKEHKNVDILINSMALVSASSNNPRYKLLIVGDGPEYENLLQQINLLNLNDDVIIMNDVDSDEEVNRLLKSSRIFINPSSKEGGGSIALFEAYSAGLPAIVFKCKDGIDPVLIKDDFTGKLVEKIDPYELAQSMINILDNPKKINKMSRNARTFVSNFDWSIISENYGNLFDSLIHKNK